MQALRERYAAERAAYHRGIWPDRYAQWVIVERDANLIGERVELISGDRVGTVIDTAHAPNGNVAALLVRLDNDKIVWIDAGDVRYNRADGIVMTNLDRQRSASHGGRTAVGSVRATERRRAGLPARFVLFALKSYFKSDG